MSTTDRGVDRRYEGMHHASETQTLRSYVSAVAARRHYLWQVASADVRSKHLRSVLGSLWYLLNPALQIAVYFLIFGVLIGTDRGVDDYIAFLAIGVFVFGFTQRSTMAGAGSLERSRGLIKIIRFPRAILPITTSVAEAMAALSAFGVMLLVVVLNGIRPTLWWALVVPLFVLQFVFNVGLSLLAARATSHLPDMRQLLPFVFRLGFYGSGVLFSADSYADSEALLLVFQLNPMYGFIEMNRAVLLGGDVALTAVVATIVWTVVVAIAGFLWFRAGEEHYGRN